jgi:hypothetical protein
LIIFAPEEAEIFKDKTTFFQKNILKLISGQIFMKFISKRAEFFEFYLFT